MAIRERTGILTPTYDNIKPTYVVYKTVPYENTGKVTQGGLVTVPLTARLQDVNGGIPALRGEDSPAPGQTKESFKETPKFNPLWLGALLFLL